MNIYTPEKQPDGTFFLSSEDMEELRQRHSPEAILTALLKLYELTREKESEEEVNGDLPPCACCGGIDFIKTGNCHACMTCGESQGCS
jgi:hypothetical protein